MKIERPRFLSGVESVKKDTRLNPYSRRPRATENSEWRPNSFKAPGVAARNAGKFSQPLNTGVKVELSEKSVNQLMSVQVPDPNDIAWAAEYKKRLAAGESEEAIKNDPPFGRKQRTVAKKVNLAQLEGSVDTKIQAVQQALTKGTSEVTQIGAILAEIVQDNKTTRAQIAQIQEVAKSLQIPSSWQRAGLPRRLYSSAQFTQNQGTIILFLVQNVPQGMDNEDRFLTLTDDTGRVDDDRFVPFDNNLGDDLREARAYLDVEQRSVIHEDYAKYLTSTEGVDGGDLDPYGKDEAGEDESDGMPSDPYDDY